MPKTFKIVGVAASGPAAGKTAGEDIILVGDTDSIKGTQGDTGPEGPAWEPTVDDSGTVTLEETPAGVIEVDEGLYIPVFAEDDDG